MAPKITVLMLLVGTILGLSHLSEERLTRMRRQFAMRRWREFVPGRRKS
jgi:hypothetical protein